MVLNVSGRCDIVAFFSNWFMSRYKEGYVDVRNPFYKKLVSRIYFDDVDLIVFCTKNPTPILDKIKDIKIPIIFHVTITPYQNDIEKNVYNKSIVIESVKKLSKIIGKENLYIRYDPIFLSDKYNLDYHVKAFDRLCDLLDGYTSHIIISFIDDYKNVKANLKVLKLRDFTDNDYKVIGEEFSSIAKLHNMTVQTCFEEHNLIEYGFIKKDCVDFNLAFKKTNKTSFKKWKARGCNCVEMVDIGVYNSCKHYCKYCYANYDEKKVEENFNNHYEDSSLLVGRIEKDDIIKIRRN
ncbi:MAG: DUF1848 domain-containing protein [bacterium]|nr:DUF1848 domain-containing protein [bacterium]